VKVYFQRTMNVTVAEPAGRSYRSVFKYHSECIVAYVYGSANKQKQLKVSFGHVSARPIA